MKRLGEEYGKVENDTTKKDFKLSVHVLYFGWSNKPSSGTVGVNIGRGVLYAVMVVFCVIIPEICIAN